MYLLLNQFYRVTCYLFHFGSKYSHLHPVLQHLELIALNERDKVSHSYKTRQNYSQCLCFYTEDGKKIDSELKGTRDLRNVIS